MTFKEFGHAVTAAARRLIGGAMNTHELLT